MDLKYKIRTTLTEHYGSYLTFIEYENKITEKLIVGDYETKKS
jgi:hypothetical protein